MENFNSYGFLIAACIIIIISYFFSQLARKTSVPSVLLLIILGVLISQANNILNFAPDLNLMPALELLGIVGLIMIVLEAALELKITKDKTSIIWKALLIALISLIVNAFLIAFIVKTIWTLDWYISLIYAVPLSIISSAIIIPSVQPLPEEKREFLIYESTFSDILGIMLFYFLLEAGDHSSGSLGLNITGSILLTIAVSFAAGYALILVFQKLKTGTNLFLLIAILVLLYSTGKLFHLSSLLLILVFGLILSNYKIFTGGRLNKYFDGEAIKKIYDNFLLITLESSFIIRTFFFLVFGLTISLASLANRKAVMVSLIILVIIFLSRYLFMSIFFKKAIFPEWQIAPRGLITILLFYGIPEKYRTESFSEFDGVLLYVILISSGLMAMGMIQFRNSHRDDGTRLDDGKIPELLENNIDQSLDDPHASENKGSTDSE